MSNLDQAAGPRLFAFKGLVAVHYLDGTTLEGEYVSQDVYNIFVDVDGTTVMISRSQIRFIKGKQDQPLEEDKSQEAVLQQSPQPPLPR